MERVPKSVGTAIGLELRDNTQALNAANDKVIKAGMAFNVSLGAGARAPACFGGGVAACWRAPAAHGHHRRHQASPGWSARTPRTMQAGFTRCSSRTPWSSSRVVLRPKWSPPAPPRTGTRWPTSSMRCVGGL